MKLSVLDLVFLLKGQSPAQAIQNSVELARFVEDLGFERFWMAEHHASPGIASSAPEILIGHVAQSTSKIRVGSGGIMDLALSSDLSMSIFARTGQSEPLRSVAEAREAGLGFDAREAVREHFPKFVGSPETVMRNLAPYLEVVDELVISTAIIDQKARFHSYQLLKETLGQKP